MATSSFDKEFKIDSQKAYDSLVEILSSPAKGVEIDTEVTSREKEIRGLEKLERTLPR